MKINAYHRVILKDYADGDFAHLAKREAISRSDVMNLGDTLLIFMLIELSEEEDCESSADALRRLTNARDDLDVAIQALSLINGEISFRLTAG